MKRIAVLFSGEGGNLQNLIETVHGNTCHIVCALTDNPNANGIIKAKHAGIDVRVLEYRHFKTREAFDQHLVAILQSYCIDLCVMAGFMRIVTPVFTSQLKAINIHPSLLPRFKGAHAIERSFYSADPQAGATVHHVTEELDGGAVILQQAFWRDTDESFQSFHKKIRAIEYEILPKAIIGLLNDLK